MKLAETREKLKTEGINEVIDFELSTDEQDTAVIFDIMVRKIYSDPMAAFIRELSTNAVDSHIEAKNDKPFDIKLPTYNDPTWYIRDYGTGLHPDDIKYLYTKIGKSDKRDSNEAVGCFGLGSKTPFAYADNFTIESFYKGKRYLYNAFIQENGKPGLGTVIDGKDTTEPDGLKITIAAKRHDTSSFIKKSEDIYKYFDKIKPNILNSKEAGYSEKKVEHILKYEGWGFRKTENDYYAYKGVNAIMGNIAYKVDTSALPSNSDEHVRHILSQSVDMYFNIGELSVEGGREKLHFNKATVSALVQKCNTVVKDIKKYSETLLKDSKNYWEACCNAQGLKTKIGNSLFNLILPTLYWNNQKIEYKGINIPRDIMIYEYYSGAANYTPRKYHVTSIYPDSNIEFYIDDLKKGALSRCANRAKDSGNKVYLCLFKDDKEKNLFLKALGIDDTYLKKASDLPVPPRVKGIGGGGGKATTKISKFTPSSNVSYCWANLEKDMDDGGYYVVTNRWKVETDALGYKSTIHPAELSKVISMLEAIGKTPPEVYGVRANLIKKANKSNKWVEFLSYAKQELDKFLKSFDLEGVWKDRLKVNDAPRLGNLHFSDISTISKELPQNNEISTLVKEYNTLSSRTDDFNKLNKICDVYYLLYNKELVKPKVKETIRDSMWNLVDKYPILNHINTWHTYTKKELTSIAQYIKCLS